VEPSWCTVQMSFQKVSVVPCLHAHWFCMLVGSGIKEQGGTILVYRPNELSKGECGAWSARCKEWVDSAHLFWHYVGTTLTYSLNKLFKGEFGAWYAQNKESGWILLTFG